MPEALYEERALSAGERLELWMLGHPARVGWHLVHRDRAGQVLEEWWPRPPGGGAYGALVALGLTAVQIEGDRAAGRRRHC